MVSKNDLSSTCVMANQPTAKNISLPDSAPTFHYRPHTLAAVKRHIVLGLADPIFSNYWLREAALVHSHHQLSLLRLSHLAVLEYQPNLSANLPSLKTVTCLSVLNVLVLNDLVFLAIDLS